MQKNQIYSLLAIFSILFQVEMRSQPAPPANLAATDGAYDNKVRVSWTQISGQFYRAYRNTVNDPNSATQLGNTWQQTSYIDDLGATPGVSYFYWAKASTSSSGANPSGYSNSDAGYKSYLIPVNVAASDGLYTNKVTITWTGTNGLFYQVYRNTQNVSAGAVAISGWQTVANFDDLTAAIGTTYFYWVKSAAGSSGAFPSNFSASNDGYRAPAAPTGVGASEGGNGYYDKVNIYWSGITGYYFRVYRSTVDNPATAVAIGTWQTAKTYDDLSAVDGVLYYYWVKSSVHSNGSNPSLHSSPSDKGHSGFNRPWNILATDGTYTDFIKVSWNGIWGSTFKVFRNTTNNPVGAVAVSGLLSSVFYEDHNVVPGTDYYYWVQASNDVGQNQSPIFENEKGYRAVRPPINPKGSLGTFCDRVRITWTPAYVPPPANPTTYYRVYRNTTSNSATATPLGTGWVTGNVFDDFTAPGVYTYYYWIKASAFNDGFRPSIFSSSTAGYKKTCLQLAEDRSEKMDSSSVRAWLNLYPNPANQTLILMVNPNIAQPIDLGIYSVAGQWIKSIESNEEMRQKGTITVGIADVPNGVYFLRGTLGATNLIRKLVVQH